METTKNLTIYPTQSSIVKGVVNGRMMSVTAAGSSEDGEKFLAMFEKQQKIQAVKRSDRQKDKTPTDKEEGSAIEDPELSQEDTLEQVKKLAGQGYAVIQPAVSVVVPESKFLERGEYTVIREMGDLFVEPGVAELQPVPPPPLEVMSVGPVGMEQMQSVQRSVTDGVAEQMTGTDSLTEQPVETNNLVEQAVQDPVQVEDMPIEEVQTVRQQVAEEIRPQEQDEEKTTVEYGEAEPEAVFHDVEAAPIKVGETARETSDVEQQLGSRLTQALEQGETRVQLQLTPEHLGAVKVEITHTAEGTVRVALSALRSETRSLLEKHADGLREALGGKTRSQVQVEVRKDEGSQRRDDHPYEGHNGQNRQQQEQRRQARPQRTVDFLQQLRLGLIMEDEQE